MKPMAVISACFALSAVAAAQTTPPATDGAGFEGLWAATRHFGPEIRGTLLIFRRGGELRADVAGFSAPVRLDGERLSFTLPDGKGEFRGRRQGSDIIGHWIQPITQSSGARYATPLVLRQESRDRWRGEVRPLEDRLSYFLPVTRDGQGRLAAYLRNPERNRGIQMPVSRMDAEGDRIRLFGRRREGEAVLLEGSYDRTQDRLAVPIQGATYDFRRDRHESSPFYARRRSGERYVYSPPVPRADGWPVAHVDEVGISRDAIERFVQMLIDLPNDGISSHQVHSVLIARRGRLVVEE
jgi:hypothetical protein